MCKTTITVFQWTFLHRTIANEKKKIVLFFHSVHIPFVPRTCRHSLMICSEQEEKKNWKKPRFQSDKILNWKIERTNEQSVQFSFDHFALFTKVRRILDRKWNGTKQNDDFGWDEQWNKSKSLRLLNVYSLYGAEWRAQRTASIVIDQKMFASVRS